MNIHPRQGNSQLWVEMVPQRLQDVGERLELLGRQGVSEVPLDGSHMGNGRTPEHPRSDLCERDLSTAAVGGAVVAADQTTPLHPSEVVGQPASLPIDGRRQLG
jgi:hypothetical protein